MSCIGKIYLSTFFPKWAQKRENWLALVMTKILVAHSAEKCLIGYCWDIQSVASGIYSPISLCWSGFLLDGMVRQWAVVVSVFCAGWQCWHSTTVNHAESCWRQLWCFYQGESYLWYWLKIMIKYEWGHQVSLRVTSWAPAPRCEHSSPVSAARPPPAPHHGRYLEFDP